MEDVQSFYRERSVIEKEYATKLMALSSKYFDKKSKLSTNISVGDNPQVTPGSLENASLVSWTETLNQTEQMAKERQRFSNELNLQIADQVHGVGVRFEDLRKRYSTFNDKLVEDRDNYYSELRKAKSGYDSTCQTMENQRLKASKNASSKGNQKVADKENDMNNAKNLYLIKLNVANRLKEKYYHEDVPELLDGLQQVNESRVALLNNLWNKSVELERSFMNRCESNLQAMEGIVAQNNPGLDSAMFVKHNINNSWKEPQDFHYEPSPIWHDDEKMMTSNDSNLHFLRTRLNEASAKLSKQTKLCEEKFETFKQLKQATKDVNGTNNSSSQILSKYLTSLQSLTTEDTVRLIYQVEVETVEVAANGKDLSALPEEVKKKRGFFRRKTSVKGPGGRAGSTNGSSGSHGGTFLSSLVSRSKSKKASISQPSAKTARVLYAYTASGDDEIDVAEAQEVTIVDDDDGSGWINVRTAAGDVGLVPATYLETITLQPTESVTSSFSTSSNNNNNNNNRNKIKKKGPTVAPKRGARKVNYMVALYDYDAKSGDELTIRTGDKILVLNADTGNGWTEGELNAMSGLFPSSYAKLL